MKYGYHKDIIVKGIYGQLSKITEELQELKDAETQNNYILLLCELSDLYGAIEAYALSMNISMETIKVMSNATKRSFDIGDRP